MAHSLTHTSEVHQAPQLTNGGKWKHSLPTQPRNPTIGLTASLRSTNNIPRRGARTYSRPRRAGGDTPDHRIERRFRQGQESGTSQATTTRVSGEALADTLPYRMFIKGCGPGREQPEGPGLPSAREQASTSVRFEASLRPTDQGPRNSGDPHRSHLRLPTHAARALASPCEA